MTKESRISDWMQIAASLGVFVGLILVAVEIRESNRFATSESIGAITQSWIDINLAITDPELARILAKSYEDPYNLSTDELMQLDGWYESVLMSYDWWLRSYELDTAEFDAAADLAANADLYFSSPFGRAYLVYAQTWARPELIEGAVAAVEGRPLLQMRPSTALIRDVMQKLEQEGAK